MNTTEQLKAAMDTYIAENEKFDGGNAAAGTRARKALQEMANLVKSRRKEISDEKNARKEAKA
jgi:hypothetical protein